MGRTGHPMKRAAPQERPLFLPHGPAVPDALKKFTQMYLPLSVGGPFHCIA